MFGVEMTMYRTVSSFLFTCKRNADDERAKTKRRKMYVVVVIDDVILNGVSFTHEKQRYLFVRMLTHSIGMLRKNGKKREGERRIQNPVF